MEGGERQRTMRDASRLVVHLVVEYSPKPEGIGSDLYLCGACGVGLTRRLHGQPLGRSHILCPNCWVLNEA